ncbi:MAG: DNA-binding protein [Clostridia bacterium]|nr:DNA-binding protein [Clostridia bacterium]
MREMTLLFDFYGGLLTERQRELCDYYYNDDLSHTEIAANTGITRQGVRDSLKKAEEILQNAEASLGFLKAWRERQTVIARLEARLGELGVCDEALTKDLKALRA